METMATESQNITRECPAELLELDFNDEYPQYYIGWNDIKEIVDSEDVQYDIIDDELLELESSHPDH